MDIEPIQLLIKELIWIYQTLKMCVKYKPAYCNITTKVRSMENLQESLQFFMDSMLIPAYHTTVWSLWWYHLLLTISQFCHWWCGQWLTIYSFFTTMALSVANHTTVLSKRCYGLANHTTVISLKLYGLANHTTVLSLRWYGLAYHTSFIMEMLWSG